MERFTEVSCQPWSSIKEKILRIRVGLSLGFYWHAFETMLV